VARGFTLIELVVTLLIASILAVAAWPRGPAKESLTLNGQADQLAADIRYAQTLAMTTTMNPATSARRGYCVRLTASTYAIEEGYDAVTAANNCITLVTHPAGLAQPYQLCNGCMTFPVLASSYVQFDGLGVPYSSATTPLAANAVITLNDNGVVRTVTISPITGRVIVQ